MLDFPNSPTTGQTFSGGNTSWAWDGAKWGPIGTVASAAAHVTMSDTAPASPNPGDLWFDTVGSQLYVFYQDPNSSQWVVVVSQTAGNVPWPSLPASVQQMPLAFAISGHPVGGAQISFPVVMALTVAASLTGSVGFAITPAAASAIFQVNKISSGTTTGLGSVTFAPNVKTPTFTGGGGTLASGDALQLIAPATQDTTLADVGITILAMRS